jgi:hypothetical protein
MFAELFAVVQPTDPQVAIGLSLLARGKCSPLYDPAALLATLYALSSPSSSSSSEPAALKAPTTAGLQAMLDSAPSGIPAPVTKAALVVSTDVSLRSTDGTADTDDRIMLILLCYFLARLATAENVHSATIALCARKKGSKDKKDTTTPEDVVQFMRERIAFFGTEASDGLEPPTPSFASFGVRGVEVRVFQLQAQTTPSPEEKLDAAGLVAQHKQIAELREANAAVFAFLEAARHEAIDVLREAHALGEERLGSHASERIDEDGDQRQPRFARYRALPCANHKGPHGRGGDPARVRGQRESPRRAHGRGGVGAVRAGGGEIHVRGLTAKIAQGSGVLSALLMPVVRCA